MTGGYFVRHHESHKDSATLHEKADDNGGKFVVSASIWLHRQVEELASVFLRG